MVFKLGYEFREARIECLPFYFKLFGAHIASRGQHIFVLANLVDLCALAESGNIAVTACPLVTAPCVIRVRDSRNVCSRQLALRSVDHPSKLPGIDEQHFPSAITEPA